MQIKQRAAALKKLGDFLGNFTDKNYAAIEITEEEKVFYEVLEQSVSRLQEQNPWFTPAFVRHALKEWAEALSPENIDKWLSAYVFPEEEPLRTVGLVLAGNIPLVGMHDWITTLMSGNRALVKMSSSDNKLLPLLEKYLGFVEPAFRGRTVFTDGLMRNIDAVIATGSNNSARYFEYYFGKYPHIIRKNRNGTAVLTGEETKEDLSGLADDIFLYFGLGCRNVTKIFVPKNFDLNRIFEASLKYSHLVNHRKYKNNYDYYRAVYLMSTDEDERQSLLENGLLLLKKDTGYASPVGVVFYERYHDLDEVKQILQHDAEKIQTIVSRADIDGAIPFGTTQKPALWDYADGVDTMDFLLHLQ